jgi:predicted amidohydrolase YtcJ
VPFVGPERAAWQYRIGKVLRLGGRVAFGSDWPASRTSITPIDQDLYALPPDAIGSASVVMTVASGQVVHGEG